MNYWFKGIWKDKEKYIELEKYHLWEYILIKWGVNGEIIDDERINKEKVKSLEEKGLYQVIEKKNILQQPDDCYRLLAKMIDLANKKGHYCDFNQTCKVAIDNFKSMRGEVFVDDRIYENTIKRYFLFYCPTKLEEEANREALERYYSQGLAYKIECSAECPKESLYLLGKSLIYDVQLDDDFLISVRDKIKQKGFDN